MKKIVILILFLIALSSFTFSQNDMKGKFSASASFGYRNVDGVFFAIPAKEHYFDYSAAVEGLYSSYALSFGYFLSNHVQITSKFRNSAYKADVYKSLSKNMYKLPETIDVDVNEIYAGGKIFFFGYDNPLKVKPYLELNAGYIFLNEEELIIENEIVNRKESEQAFIYRYVFGIEAVIYKGFFLGFEMGKNKGSKFDEYITHAENIEGFESSFTLGINF